MSEHVHKTGAELVMLERKRQLEKEGWSAEHDDQHVRGELVYAAICYAVNKMRTPHGRWQENIPANPHDVWTYFGRETVVDWVRPAWPWSEDDDKRGQHDRIRSLVIAASLIAAEIDRLLRKAGDAGA